MLNSTDEPIGYVAPAWAMDADGNAVPTRYTIAGNELTQEVDHRTDGIAYPVVADPQVIWFWWGYATKFTYSETRSIENSGSNAGALTVLCGLIASAPGAVACGLAGFIVISVGVSYVQGIVARGHCLQINNAWGLPAIFYEVTC